MELGRLQWLALATPAEQQAKLFHSALVTSAVVYPIRAFPSGLEFKWSGKRSGLRAITMAPGVAAEDRRILDYGTNGSGAGPCFLL